MPSEPALVWRVRPVSTFLAVTSLSASALPCRVAPDSRSEEHTSELQSQSNLVCRLLLEKKNEVRHGGGQVHHRLCDVVGMPHAGDRLGHAVVVEAPGHLRLARTRRAGGAAHPVPPRLFG